MGKEGKRGSRREGGRRKREIDRGESRVRQAPRVTRHSASWVGFVLSTPSRSPSPPPSWPGGIGRHVYGVVGVGAGVARIVSRPFHFGFHRNRTRGYRALDPCFKN